jgi:hypothetical protein
MENLIKLHGIDASHGCTGTSLKGYLRKGIKFADLYKTLGEPTFKPEDSGDGKVQYQWVLEWNGHVFTIYDWKTYDHEYTVNEYDRWHVGAKGYSGEFEDMVNQMIEQNNA